MASIKVPDSEYIMDLKKLHPNTYKMICYVIEYWDKVLPDSGGCWEATGEGAQGSRGTLPTIYLGIRPIGHLTSKAAAVNMKSLQERYHTYSFRISRYPIPQDLADQIAANSLWEKREATRMADGTYTPLPWAAESWFKDAHENCKHFAHVSLDKDGMIAFTENSEKGTMDIQKRMNPGRYLQEYYNCALGRLKPFETGATNVHGDKVTISPLAHYARMFSTTYGDTCELKFATDSDTMIEVYQKGPDSCMTFRDDDYAGDEHPVVVYAAGDLHLAYLVQKDGEITARALVWPEKLKVGRTYGDSSTLIGKLQELGYHPPEGYSDIVGAKMLKIPFENAYIIPFLDACEGYYHSSYCGKFWVIGERPPGTNRYQDRAIHQNGLSQEEAGDPMSTCDSCGDRGDWADMYIVTALYGRENWCPCCTEGGSFMCAESRELYSNSVPNIVLAPRNHGAPQYVAKTHAAHYFKCAVYGEWYHNDDAVGIYEGDMGILVSKDASESLVRGESENPYAPASWYRPDHLPDQLTLELDEVAA